MLQACMHMAVRLSHQHGDMSVTSCHLLHVNAAGASNFERTTVATVSRPEIEG